MRLLIYVLLATGFSLPLTLAHADHHKADSAAKVACCDQKDCCKDCTHKEGKHSCCDEKKMAKECCKNCKDKDCEKACADGKCTKDHCDKKKSQGQDESDAT